MNSQNQHDRAGGSTGAGAGVGALGGAIRLRRRRLGLSQQEVADLAGCSERTVRTIERGKATVRLDVLQQVLATLGLGLRLEPGRGAIVVPDEF
ncbi:MAG: helix-turn-helix domain-containing protein [Actinobacteria bacterium]|nr:helix-turn-helix domain-containing protein [Actinomycetota bacterium]